MSDTGQNSGAEYAAAIQREAANRKTKKDLRPLLGLWPFLRQYKGMLCLALVFLLLASAATLAFPWASGQMVENGFSSDNVELIDQYFIVFMGIAFLMVLFSSIRFFIVSWIGERVVADVRDAVYRHVTSLSPSFYEVTKTGEVISRLTTDTTLIQNVVGSTISIALRSFVNAAGALVMLFTISTKLTMLVLLVVPILLVVLILLGKPMRTLSRSNQDRIADTGAHASESLNAIQTVQAFTHEDIDRAVYGHSVQQAFLVAIKRFKVRALFMTVFGALIFASVIIVLWVGAQDVIANREFNELARAAGDPQKFNGGDLTAFIGYALFLAMGVASFSEVWAEVQRAAGAAERLIELLNVAPDIDVPANPVALPEPAIGRVELRDLTFHYPTRPEVSALDGLNLRVEDGETVALVGPSGAGKTTVFQLLLRFYDPQNGQVMIDGVNIKETLPQEFRKRISVVQQDTVIFSGSVIENIRYGRPEASDEDVREAAVAALADEFIKDLPNGYETVLGERGTTLSGGQRQRIAIARAILRDAPILLLDEATSALDAESERLVQKALDRIMKGRTTIVIAHRLATVVKADRIVVMENGRVVDTGTHDELSQKDDGLYAYLADLQFGAGDQTLEEAPLAARDAVPAE